jgi:hypothetical protein
MILPALAGVVPPRPDPLHISIPAPDPVATLTGLLPSHRADGEEIPALVANEDRPAFSLAARTDNGWVGLLETDDFWLEGKFPALLVCAPK